MLFFFLWPLYCFGVFLLIFYMFLVCFLLIATIIIYQQVLLCVHTDIDKYGDCLQSNNNNFLNDLWLLFATLFFFLKIWFNNRSNIKLRLLVILIVSVMLFLHKYIKTPNHNKGFTFDYIDTCENIQPLETQLTINHFSTSKLKYKNLNFFSQLLLLLSGDINLNLAPGHKVHCNVRMNGTFFKIDVYISFT